MKIQNKGKILNKIQILVLKKKLSEMNGRVVYFNMELIATSHISFNIRSVGKKIPI